MVSSDTLAWEAFEFSIESKLRGARLLSDISPACVVCVVAFSEVQIPYAMTLNISSTRERRDYGSAFVRLDNCSDRDIHSRDADKSPHNDRYNAKSGLEPLASPTIRPISVMVLIVKPEETGATRSSALDQTPSSTQQQHLHPISKPSSKQLRRNPNQIIENRHPNSQHKRSGIHQENQSHPHAPPENSVRVQVLRAAEDADENELARRVSV